RDALVALYQSTNGQEWVGKLNWLGAPGTECDWYGVSCDDGGSNIAGIELTFNNLKGTLPPSIGALTKLRVLNLSENHLSGAIPRELGQLTELQSLYLSYNELTGRIPDEIGNLKNVEYVGLNENKLEGPLPEGVGGMSALIDIDLSTNVITGAIPSTVGNLANATRVSIANNRLTGAIPKDFASLHKLQILSLALNQLTGAIPPELGNIDSLLSLQLNYNQLTGGIPPQLGKLRNLEELELGNNALGGTIPPELGDLASLRVLEIGDAQLTGTIPSRIYDLAKLEKLVLPGNQLDGTLADLPKLTKLVVLDLYANRITGSIPAGLRNLTGLYSIGLNSNVLTGTIPDGIGDLKELTSFDLGSNRIGGPIPAGFAALEKLEYTDLNDNELTGPLPDFSRLSKLRDFYVSRNFLSGPIPASIGGLTSLVNAQFGGNNFSGPLPREIGNWTKAWYIDFNDNQLEGAIPPELGALKELYALFLASNRFTGTIPRELGQLTNLQALYLHSNALRGPIPGEIRNLTTLTTGNLQVGYNLLFTSDASVRAFVNEKMGEDFEATQTVMPSNVQVSQMTDRSATLTWTPIAYNYDSGGYQVIASLPAGDLPAVIATTNTKDTNTITVRGLQPSQPYTFRVSTVTHPHDQQKNLLVSDLSPAVQAATTQRVNAPADVVVTAAPEGLVRIDGQPVSDDSFTLTNFGDAATSLTLEREGDFFTVEPEQFQLAGGASRVVTIKSRPQPVGSYWGRVIVRGDGAEIAVDVPLLAVARPSGTVIAQPLTTRVEVFGERGLESVGSVQFRNAGTAMLTGIVVSDQPWVVPNPQPISIEPGSVGTVNFRVIRSRRPSAEGALVANLSLVYVDGASSGGQALLPVLRELGASTPGVSVSKVSVVDVTKPPITAGSVPPLAFGEIPLFIPGVANRNNVRSDVTILNAATGAPIGDLKLYFTSGLATSIASLLPLAASQAASFVNVVNIFGATNAAGTVQVRSTKWQSLGADAKVTAVTPSGGTMSGNLPVFRGDRVTQRVHLAGLTRPGDIVVQSGASPITIDFYDANGTAFAPVTRDVPPGGLLELRDIVPAGAVSAIVTSASPTMLAYARANDPSGDLWSIVDWSAANRFNRTDAVRVPFINGASGGGGGRRRAVGHATKPAPRTDVVLFNPGTSEAKAKLQLIDTSGNVSEREVTVGAKKTVVVSSAGATASTPTAHLVVEPLKGEVAVTARSLATATGGSVGTAIPVLSATAGLRLGQSQIFSGLEDSTSTTVNAATPGTFRTTYGLTETSGAAVRVRARIFVDEAHALVTATTTRTFDLAPRQQVVLPELLRSFIPDNRDTLFGDLHDLTLELEIISGSGSIVPFVITTDNGTGDSVMRVQ
ncbi:MAG TPA: fibronectin type III domain-containing protein, partial [Thermoanaerobaculia bacterium]|nr:fibronectin type III domain-containing protein [Thermoanaerobaculia bacterium]